MERHDAARRLARFGSWPGYVFILAGVVSATQGNSSGWYAVGVGGCLVALAYWFASRART